MGNASAMRWLRERLSLMAGRRSGPTGPDAVELVERGALHEPGNPPTIGAPSDATLIAVAGLQGHLSFYRLHVWRPRRTRPREHIVLVSFAQPVQKVTPEVVQLAARTFNELSLASIVCWTEEVTSAETTSADDLQAAAIAVAAVRRSAGWDERESMRIEIDGKRFDVGLEWGRPPWGAWAKDAP